MCRFQWSLIGQSSAANGVYLETLFSKRCIFLLKSLAKGLFFTKKKSEFCGKIINSFPKFCLMKEMFLLKFVKSQKNGLIKRKLSLVIYVWLGGAVIKSVDQKWVQGTWYIYIYDIYYPQRQQRHAMAFCVNIRPFIHRFELMMSEYKTSLHTLSNFILWTHHANICTGISSTGNRWYIVILKSWICWMKRYF